MTERLLQEVKQTVKLGEIEYPLAPLNLNVLSDIETEFGCGLGDLGKAFEKKQASTVRSLLWILIKNNGINTNISREEIGQSIRLDGITSLAETIGNLITNSLKE